MPAQSEQTLVGRAAERGALHALLARAATGAGGAVVLDGEAGIGKTTLLDDVTAAAQRRGMRVLQAAARELESDRAFGAVVDAFGIRSAAARRVRPPEVERLAALLAADGDPERDLRFAVLDELADVIELWCESAPVLCVIDDLHWADPSTALALARLVRLITSLPLVLVVALRPVPRPPHVRRALDALRAAGAETLPLAPLGPADVSALARRVLGRRPGPADELRLQATGGNPLFVVEVLRAARADGIEVGDPTAALPPSLRLTLLSRISPLPERTIDALRRASLLGSTFHVVQLGLLLGCPQAEAVRALAPAFDAGLLRDTTAGEIRFRHDLVRDAVYEEMSPTLRSSLHAHAGRVLAAAGATPLDVARHVSLGAVPGDPTTGKVLVQAARQVRSTAPAVAIRLLERALELAEPLSSWGAAVRAELAFALHASGRSSDASRHAQAALASTTLSARTRVMLARLHCETLMASGRTWELRDLAGAALRDPSLMAQERAVYEVYDWLLRTHAGHDPRVDPLPDAVLDRLDSAHDDELRSLRAHGSAAMRLVAGDLPGVLVLLDEALRAAERAGTWRDAAHIRAMRAVVLAFLDQPSAADRDLQEVRRVVAELGGHSATTIGGGVALFCAGRWQELAVELDVRRQLALDEGLGPTFTELAWRAFLGVRAGAPTAPAMVVAAEEALTRQGPTMSVHLLLWARALLAERQHGVRDAAGALRDAVAARSGDRMLVRLVAPDGVRLALAAHDHDGARSMLARLEEVAQLWDAPSAHSAVRRCQALCADDPAGLLTAVEMYRRAGARPDELAATLADAAAVLARHDPARAKELAKEATSIFRRLGADVDAAACERLLVPADRLALQRPVTGWGSLTASERQVVELVSRGLRNKQIAAQLFVSPRTVETHVSHALAKLQVGSRVELAARALIELQTP